MAGISKGSNKFRFNGFPLGFVPSTPPTPPNEEPRDTHGWRTYDTTPSCRAWPDIAAGPINIPWAPGHKTPYDYFTLLFDQSIIQHITKESNMYATFVRPQQFSSLASRSRFLNSFEPLTDMDILRLLSVYIQAGISKTGSWSDLWKYLHWSILLFTSLTVKDQLTLT